MVKAVTAKPQARPELFNRLINTPNMRNFGTALGGLMDDNENVLFTPGEGRLLVGYGRAGRGKTQAGLYYAAKYGWAYLAYLEFWSVLDLMQEIALELGAIKPPHRTSWCFREIVARLKVQPRPLVLDDCNRPSPAHLEAIRSLANASGMPVILLGEEELLPVLKRNTRIWSRVEDKVEFEPIAGSHIKLYFRDVVGLNLEDADAALIQQKCDGDFRPVVRAAKHLRTFCQAKGTDTITRDMVQIVLKMNLWGAE